MFSPSEQIKNCLKRTFVTTAYRKHVQEKRRAYEERIRGEGSFVWPDRFFLSFLPTVTQKRKQVVWPRETKERVREVEHGCFTPLVFSTSGGMGKAATIVYKRLANLLSIQRNIPYPTLMGWLCSTLNFSLLKSSILCVRGSRSHSGHPVSHAPADLVLAESLYPLISLPCLV